MEITPEQEDAYREQGFLVVEGLLSDEDVAAIRADATKLCRGEYKSENLKPVSKQTTDTAALSRYLCIHQPHNVSAKIRESYMRGFSMEITPEQEESYREHGFLVVEGLLSEKDLAAIHADAVKLCRGEYKSENGVSGCRGTVER
jgi:TPP-dependent pyruvate/acetoin dehydrogenase alpha subunit